MPMRERSVLSDLWSANLTNSQRARKVMPGAPARFLGTISAPMEISLR